MCSPDVEAETPILWLPDAKSWLIWKNPDAGKDWGQEEKGTTEDEMVGWHHWLNGHEFEWPLGVGDGQGGLASCGPWSCKDLDMTKRLNWIELNWITCKTCVNCFLIWLFKIMLFYWLFICPFDKSFSFLFQYNGLFLNVWFWNQTWG